MSAAPDKKAARAEKLEAKARRARAEAAAVTDRRVWLALRIYGHAEELLEGADAADESHEAANAIHELAETLLSRLGTPL